MSSTYGRENGSALQELFTRARQHILTRLVFSADCAEAKTLSQADIISREFTSIS